MAWAGATAHHPVHGEYFHGFPCEDCYTPVRLLAVASQERLVLVIGMQKVTYKFSLKMQDYDT